jgi:uncharacterized FlaG/YvyC family protein
MQTGTAPNTGSKVAPPVRTRSIGPDKSTPAPPPSGNTAPSSHEPNPPRLPADESSTEERDAAIAILSQSMQENIDLQIRRDDETGRVVFRTVDMSTGETLRQTPSDAILNLVRALKSETGVLVNREV